MREKNIVSEYSISNMFEELSGKSRVDQEHIHNMDTTNDSMVDLCQQLTETNQDQGKQIEKLISQIEALTNLLAPNGTRYPSNENENKLKYQHTIDAICVANSTRTLIFYGI